MGQSRKSHNDKDAALADFRELLRAILDDDQPATRKFLKSNPQLSTAHFDKPTLYQSKIFHWLYVNDTALHLAAAGYRVEIAKMLIEAGANPNAALNHRRGRPLHYAADGNPQSKLFDPSLQIKMIQLLLDAGAEINAADANGATALHRAVRTRCAAAVKHLLHAGADPLIKNKPGSTAFHLAVQNTGRGGSGDSLAKEGQREIINLMLEHGVSPMTKDSNGKTVRDWAKSDWIRQMFEKGSAA